MPNLVNLIRLITFKSNLCLISEISEQVPSSFSTERLDVIKQLTRAKKMKGHPSCGHVS